MWPALIGPTVTAHKLNISLLKTTNSVTTVKVNTKHKTSMRERNIVNDYTHHHINYLCMCVLEKEKELVKYSDLASEEKLTYLGVNHSKYQ